MSNHLRARCAPEGWFQDDWRVLVETFDFLCRVDEPVTWLDIRKGVVYASERQVGLALDYLTDIGAISWSEECVADVGPGRNVVYVRYALSPLYRLAAL